MALHLSKSKRIVRETVLTEIVGKYRGKSIIMEVLPSHEIKFRIKGTQQSFTAHLAHLLVAAKIVEAKADYDRRMEKYNQNRKFGKRAKKPKKLFLPYASAYVKGILS